MIGAEKGKHEMTQIYIRGLTATVHTSQLSVAKKLDKYCELYPEAYRLTAVHKYGEPRYYGLVDYKEYEVKKKCIRFAEPDTAPEKEADDNE